MTHEKNAAVQLLDSLHDYARPKQTAQHLRISTSTLWLWSKTRADFPKPIKAGLRTTLFDLTAINDWLRQQQEAA